MVYYTVQTADLIVIMPQVMGTPMAIVQFADTATFKLNLWG
ncbi:hypothetical protein METMT2_0407 [Methanothermobacter sp. MT-2]|nr:hypothetical protein METMT2_0407 [Methanothermobacter sp. MT-2]